MAFLCDLDALGEGERWEARDFLRLWAAMEDSRRRRWDADTKQRPPKILGKEA